MKSHQNLDSKSNFKFDPLRSFIPTEPQQWLVKSGKMSHQYRYPPNRSWQQANRQPNVRYPTGRDYYNQSWQPAAAYASHAILPGQKTYQQYTQHAQQQVLPHPNEYIQATVGRETTASTSHEAPSNLVNGTSTSHNDAQYSTPRVPFASIENQPPPRGTTTNKRKYKSKEDRAKELIDAYKSMSEAEKMPTLREYIVGRDGDATRYPCFFEVWKKCNLVDLLQAKTRHDSPEVLSAIHQGLDISANKKIASDRGIRLPASEWRRLLFHCYTMRCYNHKVPLAEIIESASLEGKVSRARLSTIWKETGLDALLKEGVPDGDLKVKDAIEKKYPRESDGQTSSSSEASASSVNEVRGSDVSSTRRDMFRNRNLSKNNCSYLLPDEEETLAAFVTHMLKVNSPISVSLIKEVIDNYIREGLDEETREFFKGISTDTTERIYQNADIEARGDVNSIDPRRVEQSNPENYNMFLHKTNNMLEILYELYPDIWPYKRFADVPPSHIYNTDEQGPNPTKLRDKCLCPKDMTKEYNRLFVVTSEGDGKMETHITVCNFVCANGAQCHPAEGIEGAAPPMMLIADKSSETEIDKMSKLDRDEALMHQSADDEIEVSESLLDGWLDPHIPGVPHSSNKYGMIQVGTASGSQLRRTFYMMCLHFKDNLPHDQGPNGRGVILTLDWHASRECPQSLIEMLLKYNILIAVLPSKTSIWSQPCDNGKNLKVLKAISRASAKAGMLNSKSLSLADANIYFREGLEKSCDEENNDLRKLGTNVNVRSFEKTGLYPQDYFNKGWADSTKFFGTMRNIEIACKQKAGIPVMERNYAVKLRNEEDREALTNEDKELIMGYTTGFKKDWEIPLLLVAHAVLSDMLDYYIRKPGNDYTAPPEAMLDEDLEISVEQYASMKPAEQVAFDKNLREMSHNFTVWRAALKLFHFAPVSPEHRVDTTCRLSEEEVQRDKLRTRLAITPIGQSIELKLKDGGRRVSISKLEVNRFMWIDAQARPEERVKHMTCAEVLADLVNDSLNNPAEDLSSKQKEKVLREKRRERKQLQNMHSSLAEEKAFHNRENRNSKAVMELLMKKSGKTEEQLSEVLDSQLGIPNLSDFSTELDDIFSQGYSENVVVGTDKNGKDIKVAVDIAGRNFSAVNQSLHNVMIQAVTKKSGNDRESGKKRQSRGNKLSTKKGGIGVDIGIRKARIHYLDKLEKLNKDTAASQKEKDTATSLLRDIEKLQRDYPNDWFLVESSMVVTRLKILLQVMGLQVGGQKKILLDRLQEVTKEKLEARITQLKTRLRELEEALPHSIAEVRETQDSIALLDGEMTS